jgi:predicted kinase
VEAIIFCGIQASGKSSFYKEQFFRTHMRISLDLLNTRNKESLFLQACFETQQRFVVDNTNPTAADRQVYIEWSRAYHYKVIGYYFGCELTDALSRNTLRTGKERVPEIGLRGTFRKLEVPQYVEGFDELYQVCLSVDGFTVQSIPNEI